MKILIQRVLRGSVTVENAVVGSIGKGVVVLVGIGTTDSEGENEHQAYMVNKVCLVGSRILFESYSPTAQILNTKFWPDAEGRPWKCSVSDLDLEVLLVSQFTLYAQPVGRKLDFHKAMSPAAASEYFDRFVQLVRQSYKSDRVQTGQFGADMQVELVNDGPVTVDFCSDGIELPKTKKTIQQQRQQKQPPQPEQQLSSSCHSTGQ